MNCKFPSSFPDPTADEAKGAALSGRQRRLITSAPRWMEMLVVDQVVMNYISSHPACIHRSNKSTASNEEARVNTRVAINNNKKAIAGR